MIIADEPTGELDSKTSLKLLELLRTIVDEAGVTLVMASHDATVEQYADATYRLQDGEIISRTTRAEAIE